MRLTRSPDSPSLSLATSPTATVSGFLPTQTGGQAIVAELPSLRDAGGFLNLPDDETGFVFDQPGRTPLDCSPGFFRGIFGRSNCVGRPEAGAEMSIRDTAVVEVKDPDTGERRSQSYYKVRYRQLDERSGRFIEREGWIYADVIAIDPLYEPPTQPDQPNAQSARPGTNTPPRGSRGRRERARPMTEPCNSQPPTVPREQLGRLRELGDTREESASRALDAIVERVSPVIGTCLANPPGTPPDLPAASSPFNDLILAQRPRMNVPPGLTSPNGDPVTRDQLLEIDALARTIYGEMSGCAQFGSQYLLAVAAVVKNRQSAIERGAPFRGQFVREQRPNVPLIAQIVGAHRQFNVWDARYRNPTNRQSEPNRSLHKGLCPPARDGSNFWRGHAPPEFERRIWNTILRISAQAVLDPDAFRSRTSEVTQYFYTSGREGFHGLSRAHPRVDGASLSNGRCVQIWEGPAYPPNATSATQRR